MSSAERVQVELEGRVTRAVAFNPGPVSLPVEVGDTVRGSLSYETTGVGPGFVDLNDNPNVGQYYGPGIIRTMDVQFGEGSYVARGTGSSSLSLVTVFNAATDSVELRSGFYGDSLAGLLPAVLQFALAAPSGDVLHSDAVPGAAELLGFGPAGDPTLNHLVFGNPPGLLYARIEWEWTAVRVVPESSDMAAFALLSLAARLVAARSHTVS
jgi:hypothetical protein